MPIDLVTGGGGYLGGNLAKALLSLGRQVRIFDVQKTSNCPAEAEFVQGDMRNREEVRKALEGVGRVFHIAFVQSLSKRPEAERYAINIGGMENFLEESLAAKVARFIHTSTIEIYGTRPPLPAPETAPTDEPVGWYGRHKLICEQMLWRFHKDTGVPCSALRMPTICGRGFYNHRPLLELMDRVLDGKSVGVIGDGSTPGDFVLLEDVLQGFLLAGDRPEAVGEAFNISCRAPSTQLEIVKAMIDEAESKSAVVRVPAPLAKAGLWVGRLLKVHDLPPDQDGYLFHPNS
ncbi:MAG: NAD(P)-dependent oxidoreductase, partial [Bdellovibrionota bacterium]